MDRPSRLTRVAELRKGIGGLSHVSRRVGFAQEIRGQDK